MKTPKLFTKQVRAAKKRYKAFRVNFKYENNKGFTSKDYRDIQDITMAIDYLMLIDTAKIKESPLFKSVVKNRKDLTKSEVNKVLNIGYFVRDYRHYMRNMSMPDFTMAIFNMLNYWELQKSIIDNFNGSL